MGDFILKDTSTLRSDKVDLTAVYQFAGELELSQLHGYVIQYVKNIKQRIDELHHAFDCNDFEKVKAVAHNMKSGALYIGAQKLSESCQYLETSTITKPLDLKLILLARENVQSELNEVIDFLETWSDSVE